MQFKYKYAMLGWWCDTLNIFYIETLNFTFQTNKQTNKQANKQTKIQNSDL